MRLFTYLKGEIYLKGTIAELKTNRTNQFFEHALRNMQLTISMIKILKYSFFTTNAEQMEVMFISCSSVLGFCLLFLDNELSKAVIT